MFKTCRYALAVGLLSLAHGCAGERPRAPSTLHSTGPKEGATASKDADAAVGSPDKPSVLPSTITTALFDMKSVSQDAADFTFGTASFVFKTDISGSATVERYLYLSDTSKLSAAQKTALLPLCRDISLVPGAEEQLSWRSHYSLTIKRVIADLMQNGQSQILCVMKITENRNSTYLALDPVPVKADSVIGSSKADVVVAQNLMVPVSSAMSLPSKNFIPVEEQANIVSGVKALASSAINLAPKDETGISCYYDTSKTGSVIGNPQTAKKSIMALKVPAPVKIQGFVPVSIGGRIQKNCSNVALASTDDTVQAQFSCQTYQDIKSEGLEAGCQWELEMANSADLGNSVAVPLKMSTLAFRSINPKNSDEMLSLLPKDSLNPVRNKSTTFTGFTANQLKYAELAFDLWLAVYPKSYIDDFKDFMKTVVLSDTCDAGIGGFARVNSNSFTWCSPNLTDAVNNPTRPVFHAILVAHETRHSRGFTHDIDNATYTPCQGSAASAAVMAAIVTSCKEDYCAVIRNAAVNEYITELNYSLKGDARRFQGQCKEWSTAMGLTDTAIQNPSTVTSTP